MQQGETVDYTGTALRGADQSQADIEGRFKVQGRVRVGDTEYMQIVDDRVGSDDFGGEAADHTYLVATDAQATPPADPKADRIAAAYAAGVDYAHSLLPPAAAALVAPPDKAAVTASFDAWASSTDPAV